MKKLIKLLIIIAIGFALINFYSCTPYKRLQRLERKHPELFTVPVAVSGIQRGVDSVLIDNENLTILAIYADSVLTVTYSLKPAKAINNDYQSPQEIRQKERTERRKEKEKGKTDRVQTKAQTKISNAETKQTEKTKRQNQKEVAKTERKEASKWHLVWSDYLLIIGGVLLFNAFRSRE